MITTSGRCSFMSATPRPSGRRCRRRRSGDGCPGCRRGSPASGRRRRPRRRRARRRPACRRGRHRPIVGRAEGADRVGRCEDGHDDSRGSRARARGAATSMDDPRATDGIRRMRPVSRPSVRTARGPHRTARSRRRAPDAPTVSRARPTRWPGRAGRPPPARAAWGPRGRSRSGTTSLGRSTPVVARRCSAGGRRGAVARLPSSSAGATASGTTTSTTVPFPGDAVTVSRPPSRSARDSIPARPEVAVGHLRRVEAAPVVETTSRTPSATRPTSSRTSRAPACLTTLWSASWAIR